jgi:hypothetical protein
MLLAAAVAVLAPGCGRETSLEGSLGEVVSFGFESVEVAVTSGSVGVSYYRPQGAGRDVVFKLVVAIAPASVPPGQDLDLAPRPDGTPNAVCTRSVGSDPIHTFAAVRVGTFTLDRVPTVDQPVTGSFRVTLGEGGEAGKGRTAFGNFKVARVVPGG